MIFICGSHGYLSKAEALLSEMEERGINPDTKTYNIFLSLSADVGNIDAVLLLCRKIREDGLFPDEITHRAILQILCNRNMVQEVEAVIEEMETSKMHIDTIKILSLYLSLSSRTYAAIVDVYAKKGLWPEAEIVFYSKRGSFGQKREVLEYNVMIKTYGKAKLYDKSFLLFKSMKTHGTWPDECTTFSAIARVCMERLSLYADLGMVSEAKMIYDHLQEKNWANGVTFATMIYVYKNMGMLDEAIEVAKEM
ncbi:unnamed protein product [Fraxinus pennsylvanica]|uniref:Pentatricopeptide repeat-containing protein n=1 Tax=Fraxinus pennsylvanica TaxID=56036 RepID=A0AAD1ZGJ7_9LAMI|nr:unnamed protein product [Fraxinus pennsylvanica]